VLLVANADAAVPSLDSRRGLVPRRDLAAAAAQAGEPTRDAVHVANGRRAASSETRARGCDGVSFNTEKDVLYCRL
jgi:hypothetical protein